MQNLDEAYRMLDVFASVGATQFDVTFLDIDGAKRGFRKGQSVRQLKNSLPLLLPGLTERRNSLVVRPQSEKTALIQLDDLDATALERVQDIAFLTLATSPGNHQAWVAVDHFRDTTKMVISDIARRLRKGVSADPSASGAVRIAGTVNYKKKYQPDFPTVALLSTFSGRIVNPEKLEYLLAPREPMKIAPAKRWVNKISDRKWPSYEMSLAGAPMNKAGTGPSRSHADFWWCKLAAQRRFSVEEIAAELLNVSEKARERLADDPGYITTTAANGAAAWERDRISGTRYRV